MVITVPPNYPTLSPTYVKSFTTFSRICNPLHNGGIIPSNRITNPIERKIT